MEETEDTGDNIADDLEYLTDSMDILGTNDENESGLGSTSNLGVSQVEEFAIPELPSGISLCFVLLSAWDDPFFMGLNAIEVFTAEGARADVLSINTNATECFGELASLLYCKTCPCTDPQGMWLARHSPNAPPITVTIQLKVVQTIAMIRIWNYCESRVHALRGVRRMRIELDETCIFKGEISCAFSGENEVGKPLGDTILFTTNEEILNKIAENDVFLNEVEDAAIPSSQLDMLSLESSSENDNFTSSTSSFNNMDGIQRPTTSLTGRPLSSSPSSPSVQKFNGNDSVHPLCLGVPSSSAGCTSSSSSKSDAVDHLDDEEDSIVRGKVFHIELTANWGSADLIGLTGIQFLGPNSEQISTENCVIRCSTDPVVSANNTALLRLTNGRNLSCEAEDMWLTSWAATEDGTPPTLSFTFPREIQLAGVSIWNYNASPELTYAGVKCAQFFANGRPIVNAVLLRRAPGYVFFDYVQDVMFNRCHLFRPLTSRPNTHSISAFMVHTAAKKLAGKCFNCLAQDHYIGSCQKTCVLCKKYLPGQCRCDPREYVDNYGRPIISTRTMAALLIENSLTYFIFQLRLLSSWGDEFYIGLNGIELYNRRNQLIKLKLQNLAAFPESVNVLPSVERDPRSSDKLIDGINDTKKPQHMWLTPMLPNRYARIFLIFDSPTFVSRIRIYNYRKTPARGVRHIAVSADDLIIYSGEVPQSDSQATGQLDISLRDLD